MDSIKENNENQLNMEQEDNNTLKDRPENQQEDPNPIGSRKKQPTPFEEADQKHPKILDIEQPAKKKLKFQDLNETVTFYLMEIYQFMNRMLITGIMKNGQTINVYANEVYRDYYFALKRENADTDQVSNEFLRLAKKEIDQRLKEAGVENIVHADWQEKSYVFEIGDVPEGKRPYYRVRFPFKVALKDGPNPDWEGQYFKYVFGTTYTPTEIFIIQSKIKGPCWVSVDLRMLT